MIAYEADAHQGDVVMITEGEFFGSLGLVVALNMEDRLLLIELNEYGDHSFSGDQLIMLLCEHTKSKQS